MKTYYSLWLIPSSPVYEYLTNYIADLAEKYQTASFEPHLTPLIIGFSEFSQEELIAKTQELADKIGAIPLELGPVSMSNTFYQSVFVRVKASAVLMEAHLTAKEIFEIKDEHFFMPHMSLLYADFFMKQREEIMKEIKLECPRKFHAQKLALIGANEQESGFEKLAEIEL